MGYKIKKKFKIEEGIKSRLDSLKSKEINKNYFTPRAFYNPAPSPKIKEIKSLILSNYQPLELDVHKDIEANNSLNSFTEIKLEQLYGKSLAIDKKITYIDKMFSKTNNIKFLRKQNN